MVNAIQLLLLLPLIGTYLPQSILDFIRGLNFNMLNFDFLTSKFQNDENDASSFVDFDQANDYLNLIGLQSESTAINLLQQLWYSWCCLSFTYWLDFTICTLRKSRIIETDDWFCSRSCLTLSHSVFTLEHYLRHMFS